MSKKVIITDMPVEYDGKQYFHTVSAVFEDNKCIMLNINNNNSITGNIYLGRVLNIVNNINSAFVSIDKDNTCYYSLTDNRRHYFFNPKNNNNVNQGDSILVQVKKDAVKTKPASLSSDIVISGYYVVLSTDVEGVLVSKKIHDSEQIIQLRHKLLDLLKEKYDDNPDIPDKHNISPGFIIRTNACNLSSVEDGVIEAEQLLNSFITILRKAIYSKAPLLLKEEKPAYLDLINKIQQEELDEVVTDNKYIYTVINSSNHELFSSKKLRLYSDNMLALYKQYDISKEINNALSRKVWLKCGGYIIIEPTEAMTVIDVNSGKYVSRKKGTDANEETYFTVNIQAAVEIARQLRIRNVSGIIMVDFINMNNQTHVDELISILKKELKTDPVTASVIDITKLGLVEITRKRTGSPLKDSIITQ